MKAPSSSVLLLLAGGLAAVAFPLFAPSSAPAVLVLLLAGGYAVSAARTSPVSLSPDRLVRAGLFVAVAAGVLVPALLGGLFSLHVVLSGLVDAYAAVNRRDVLAAALGFSALLFAARFWPERLGERAFLAVGTVAALAVKLAYVQFVHLAPFSDFAGMWNVASRVAVDGLPATQQWVAGSPGPLQWIYLERVLPFLLPLRLAFGPGPGAYTVANVLANLAASGLTYILARGWFGNTAARVAFVLSLAAPETLMTSILPNHEVPGALYTLLGLFLIDRACRLVLAGRERAALAASLLFGAVAVIVGLQRTTGPFFLLPCAALALLAVAVGGERRRTARAAVLLAVAPLALYLGLSRILRAADLMIPPEVFAARRGLVLMAGSDSWTDGSFAHFAELAQSYDELPVRWYPLAAAKIASDTWHTPSARVTGYVAKSRSLYDLGTQTYFYVQGAEVSGLGVIEGRRVDRMTALSRCFSVVFVGCFLVGCLRLFAARGVPLRAFVPLGYLAVVSSLILFFALVQPRYLYQIWFVGAIYAGFAFGPAPRAEGDDA
ncbi:MAG TPA: hypothetical protein VLT87_06630 [Thermoanaerobaculia bacterium]|nr:hypothetical protein [Thermoanaerobaculia bacterium]